MNGIGAAAGVRAADGSMPRASGWASSRERLANPPNTGPLAGMGLNGMGDEAATARWAGVIPRRSGVFAIGAGAEGGVALARGPYTGPAAPVGVNGMGDEAAWARCAGVMPRMSGVLESSG